MIIISNIIINVNIIINESEIIHNEIIDESELCCFDAWFYQLTYKSKSKQTDAMQQMFGKKRCSKGGIG